MNTNNKHTALLVMDMQMAIIRNRPDYKELTDKTANAIAFARAQQIPVLFVVVQFRPGMPEISANNKLFAASKERAANVQMPSGAMDVDSALSPLEGDIIIPKRRVSAFTGSDLEVVLRSQGIQHLVMTGVATSGVVLSTLREAADNDYRITVLSDCCADRDPEVHTVLMEKIFPMQATVISAEEWTKK